MAHHTLPATLPADWLASFKMPSSEGSYETWIVVHPSQSNYHPFVCHKACYVDEGAYEGKWEYAHGIYCKDETEALEAFKERTK